MAALKAHVRNLFGRAGWWSDGTGDGASRPVPVWWIRNNTPRPIWFEHDDRVFTLAPLEERTWSNGRGFDDQGPLDSDPRVVFPQLARLADKHQVQIDPRPGVAPSDVPLIAAVRVTLIVGVLWVASFWPLSLWWWQRIGGVLAIAFAVGFLLLITRPSRRQASRQVRRWTWYNATMVAVVAVGVLMPAVVLYLATDLNKVISIWPDGFRVDADQPLVIIGRLMQLIFITVATLLPALMYFQFDAERLGTLRDRWIQNVFRLDPTVSTVCDVNAKYGRQLDEAYGSTDEGRGRLTRGRRSPIILTTLILAFGWLLILLKAGDRIDVGPAEDPGLSFVSLLDPDQSLVAFAFLGAYFFGLQLIWQGYVRADLRPKTYTTIAVRVLVVVILAWLIEATMNAGQSPELLYLLAFGAGFVPDRVLHLLWERVAPVLGRRFALFAEDRQQPLTELEGIDLYERTRLSEEGITSVEALAHHDLLDLFFKTRIPAARLVDWTDQAVLVMYLGPNGWPACPAPAPASDSTPAPDRSTAGTAPTQRLTDRPPSGPTLRAALRSLGIRTASDLVGLMRRSEDGDGTFDQVAFDTLAEAVAGLLPSDECRAVRYRLKVLAATLDHSEWLGRIENWRRSDLIEADARKRRYIDGRGDLKEGDPRLLNPAATRRPDVHATARLGPSRRLRRSLATLVLGPGDHG